MLVIQANRYQKQGIRSKKMYFIVCFKKFFPLFMLKSELLSRSFLKIDGIDLLSLQKKHLERIAPVALFKRATMSESIPLIFKRATRAIGSFSRANCSFDHKKSDSLGKPMIESPTLVGVQWVGTVG